MTRRRLSASSSPMCGTRVAEVVDEVDAGITKHLGDVATELGSRRRSHRRRHRRPEVPAPPLKSRRLETQLMMVLGAGFGSRRRARQSAGCSPGSRRV